MTPLDQIRRLPTTHPVKVLYLASLAGNARESEVLRRRMWKKYARLLGEWTPDPWHVWTTLSQRFRMVCEGVDWIPVVLAQRARLPKLEPYPLP